MSDSKQKQTKGSQRLENIIEENRVRREQRRFLEELGKRMHIARMGRLSYEKGDLSNALKHYRRFMMLTAKFHKVEIPDLNPKLFNEKERTAESLLISAITLDVAKIVDLVSGPGAREERQLYLKLFRTFTVGMPFQGFVAEGLRKYINHSKLIKNKNDFQTTYNAVKISGVCFVATATFGDIDAPEVRALRSFRDKFLWPSAPGRMFINIYYVIGPWLAMIVTRSKIAKRLSKAAICGLLRILPE